MIEMIIGGIIGVLSLIYLFYVLLYPEQLQADNLASNDPFFVTGRSPISRQDIAGRSENSVPFFLAEPYLIGLEAFQQPGSTGGPNNGLHPSRMAQQPGNGNRRAANIVSRPDLIQFAIEFTEFVAPYKDSLKKSVLKG